MPRENRKRGKKHKNTPQEEELKQEGQPIEDHPVEVPAPSQGEASWILPSSKKDEEVNPDAPFGFLDLDVKAYFRTVDVQIRDWQKNREELAEDGDVDPNEERRLFFVAALQEMQGKEKQLATDPDCSVILERILYSMDDFVRRVFVDSLSGSYGVLARHRFASHVCQTLFTVARDTIAREAKGIFPNLEDSPDKGELRTLTQLVVDVSEELLPDVSSLVADPFASHVTRSLLLLLSPSIAESENTKGTVRSKKSAAWKARQGDMKSVFDNVKGKGKETVSRNTPPAFQQMARRFVQAVRDELDENEVRAMAANKVACPGLKMLLEVEADQDMANEPGSLMDRVTVGIVTAYQDDPDDPHVEESDYLGTLIRDPNASHLLESIVSCCPTDAFDVLWKTYLEGQVRRLALHPVANFVVAKAFERVSESQLSGALEDLKGSWKKLIQTSRTGVMKAAVDRITALNAATLSISEAMFSAVEIQKSEDRKMIVPCLLTLLPLPDYNAALTNPEQPPENYRHGAKAQPVLNPLDPKIQGSLLLQSLLQLPEPLNQFVVDSIIAIPVSERIKISYNPSGSRVFDALMDSPTVQAKMKRQFVMDFIGHYHVLVDDKLGSRVGDRCWSFCDTYLKEKIARSLIPNEHELAASFYGKFFARNLNLYLLQRRPGEWRDMQSGRKQSQQLGSGPTTSKSPAVATVPNPTFDTISPGLDLSISPSKRKRKNRPEDEIDALFNEKLGKKLKKGAFGKSPVKTSMVQVETESKDLALQQVLGAIRAVPKEQGSRKSGQ